MIKLKIHDYLDREAVLYALAKNGYTVKLGVEEQLDHYLTYDYFVIIVEEPKIVLYKSDVLLGENK